MDTLNQSPVASGGQMPLSPTPEPQKTAIGPIVGAIVVIFILAAGGLYFWGAQLNRNGDPVPYIPSDETVPAAGDSDTTSGLPPQSSSDEATAIAADLEAMNFNQFESQTETDVQNFDSETQ